MLQYPMILLVDNEGPDQPALMRRLSWICIVRKLHKNRFRVLRIIFLYNENHVHCVYIIGKIEDLTWVVI